MPPCADIKRGARRRVSEIKWRDSYHLVKPGRLPPRGHRGVLLLLHGSDLCLSVDHVVGEFLQVLLHPFLLAVVPGVLVQALGGNFVVDRVVDWL